MSADLNHTEPAQQAPRLSCEWISPPAGTRHDTPFLLRLDDCDDAAATRHLGVVLLGGAGEARARELLQAGFAGVLLGDAVLYDLDVVDRLTSRFGAERVGVAVSAARLEVAWSLDAESNADFRIMRPSHALPDWEVLREDGAQSGVLLSWWLGRAFERGVGRAVVGVDIVDDADLNILAGLIESFGARLAIELRQSVQARIDDCIRLAGVRHLAADWAWRERLPEALGQMIDPRPLTVPAG